MESASARAKAISRAKKEKYFRVMSEDHFRDEIVRPLFYRLGYGDGRDLCGPTEHGKDALFSDETKHGTLALIAVQTKKGSLNLSRKITNNVTEAATQLRTALQVSYVLTKDKKSVKPEKAILCCSGKINNAARIHILSELSDPRVEFLDVDDLINLIDNCYPEIWFGIDAELIPYYRAIKSLIEGRAGNDAQLSATKDLFQGAATDENFVQLVAFRSTVQLKTQRGQVTRSPQFEECEVESLAEKPSNRILLLGEGGAGKSTIIKRIAYKAVQRGISSRDRYVIPIVIPAVDIAKNLSNDLTGILENFCRFVANTDKACFTADDLVNGRVLLLIDALDEIANDKDRRGVVRVVNAFSKQFPKVKIIMTSRMYSYIRSMEELSVFDDYMLNPISLKQASRIVENIQRGKKVPRSQTQELLRRIEEVHGIELSPLLVTVFAATADYNRSDIPANITELFKKFTELMLGRWDEEKGLSQQFHAPLKDFLCQKLAYELHVKENTRVSISSVRQAIGAMLVERGHEADIDQIIYELIFRSGLFRQIGDEIEFRHHLLQEFFAGRAISSLDIIKENIASDWWLRPIVFYFGESPEAVDTLRTVAESALSAPDAPSVNAANAIGLALQACYLSSVEMKISLWKWVAIALGINSTRYLDYEAAISKYPLQKFLNLYVMTRDAVALGNVREHVSQLREWWMESNISSNKEKDSLGFWLAVALMEIGEFEKLEMLLEEYTPSNAEYLLALHLGCFLSYEVRMLDDSKKLIAKRVMDNLSPRIESVRQQFAQEFKSELLEIRKGRLHQLSEDLMPDG